MSEVIAQAFIGLTNLSNTTEDKKRYISKDSSGDTILDY
jgi:hypothetical protein